MGQMGGWEPGAETFGPVRRQEERETSRQFGLVTEEMLAVSTVPCQDGECIMSDE